MSNESKLEEMITGKDKYYSDKKFVSKVKKFGGGLGYKTLQGVTTLFVALKSPEMSKANKLIVAGALGYFILPLDVVADFLPFIGLSDDAFVILAALSKVYMSITDEMKEEAAQMLEKTFGERDSNNI